jgi:hypothetical protein
MPVVKLSSADNDPLAIFAPDVVRPQQPRTFPVIEWQVFSLGRSGQFAFGSAFALRC